VRATGGAARLKEKKQYLNPRPGNSHKPHTELDGGHWGKRERCHLELILE